PSFVLFSVAAPSGARPLSLHDALPISGTMALDMARGRDSGRLYRYAGGRLDAPLPLALVVPNGMAFSPDGRTMYLSDSHPDRQTDRKSTRLNSSHVKISYAVFCLKKKT